MEPLLVIALAVGGALVAAAHAHGKRRRRAEIWRRSAEACGLTHLTESRGVLWAQLRRERRQDDRLITITSYGTSKSERGTRIRLETPDSCLAGVTLHAESLVTGVRKMFGTSEVEVGDPAFDAEFFVGGQPAASLAFLDAEMRRLLADLKASCRRMEVARGALVVDVREGFGMDLAASLPHVLYKALEIGRRWPHHTETAARIAHNALRDPHIGVRLYNLLVLVRELGGDRVVKETLRAACADPWPEIRLRAATALGLKGNDALFALAEGLEDDVAAKAIGALGRWLTPERATAILDDAIRSRRDATAAACIGLLGRVGDDAAVARLTRILTGRIAALKVPAAQALGWSGHAGAEAGLLEGLARGAPRVRRAAAAALGQVGTVAAVLPLKEAAERNDGLRGTVRQSIAAIQARATGASPGQVSLSTEAAGQVSLAAGDAGRLSLPAEEPGRLAVSGEKVPK